MGLFDQVAGQMLGGLAGGGGDGASPLMQLVQSLLQQEGGVMGLISKLQEGGLAAQVASWIGGGDNLPVSGEQIQQALGSDLLTSLGGQVGMTADQAGNGLADQLPGLIDKLSPGGSLEGNEQLLQQGLSMLGGLLGGR
ncbi:MAG: DUF937 domain-containing protein [Rhodocyclaceae bacterium]|nr:DUF937 domain-containing protein [Rhodocyclaceae bacterium]